MNTNKTTHIVNLAGNTYKTLGNNKPLAISISQVFACAQPLPLQEDAKHQSKGKMTTIAGNIFFPFIFQIHLWQMLLTVPYNFFIFFQILMPDLQVQF